MASSIVALCTGITTASSPKNSGSGDSASRKLLNEALREEWCSSTWPASTPNATALIVWPAFLFLFFLFSLTPHLDHPAKAFKIPASDIEQAARDQNVSFQVGDILLLRTGWIAWYEQLSQQERIACAKSVCIAAGLAQGQDSLRFLWNNHFSAVAGDSPTFEAWPSKPQELLHPTLLGLWGMLIGEMFFVEDLAADCARDGVYEAFLTSSPLNKENGVASPPCALAIK
eukprot:TRINITY_DN2514_c0_g1_i5.p1 TRINITY_DN2514_c0_g1~~TRINITY_DN2514_c0_g1_i5.p1  ORF type:complete len:229 (+),score=39.81 TRINITY_DN2514_c0_g1_i5:305-991(+)